MMTTTTTKIPLGARIRIGIDLPEQGYAAGATGVVTAVGRFKCAKCRRVYRVRFDDGGDFPVLERHLHMVSSD